MVDRDCRSQAAGLLVKLRNGELTNHEFEEAWPKSQDSALRAIGSMVWNYYSDLEVHTLAGRYELSPDQQALVDRCVLFLEHDLEYDWPLVRFDVLGPVDELLDLPSFGLLNRVIRARLERMRKEMDAVGDINSWPFLDKERLDAATASATAGNASSPQ